MSIPLDRLYSYISDIAGKIYGEFVLIYRFFPHGSKNIENLQRLLPVPADMSSLVIPEIFCNDQEPLNHQLYEGHSTEEPNIQEILKRKNISFNKFNMRGEVKNMWDHAIIIHSEQRSQEVELYQQSNFIPVYYWSHAIIAQDWFRYAQHLKQQKKINKLFLIYNRAWSGTREYRLKFAELLIKTGLENSCKMSVNPIEPELGIHYELHKFSNPQWRPTEVLENYFPVSGAHSHYSADFDIDDYQTTDIEIVLETLFDDLRLHLTEKILRPIACGQPFILAGTHGSLKYLRSYGFKTFEHLWDERYDLIENPQERLIAISGLMQQIANWDFNTRENKMSQARIIAEYNKKHFFSQDFFNQVTNELYKNLQEAFTQLSLLNTSRYCAQRRDVFVQDAELIAITSDSKQKFIEFIRSLESDQKEKFKAVWGK
jgi:hypothetical protein